MRVNECIYTTVVSKTNVVKGTARENKMMSKYKTLYPGTCDPKYWNLIGSRTAPYEY